MLTRDISLSLETIQQLARERFGSVSDRIVHRQTAIQSNEDVITEQTTLTFKTSKKVTDPVCRMEMNTEEAVEKSEYQGRTYYFCTPGCK